MPYSFFLLFIFVTVSLAPQAGAESALQAERLLSQTVKANHTLNYEGTLIYRRPGVMDTMRIIHKVDENGVRERITLLTGSAREVVRTKDSVMCILPDTESVMIEKNTPGKLSLSQLPGQIAKASEYYSYVVVGRSRVANRLAWVVDITPVDEYRFGYRLWIDAETKLLIKSELRNDRDQALEQFFFVGLHILEYIHDDKLIPELSDKVNMYGRYGESAGTIPAVGGESGAWRANWLPDGFDIVGREKQAAGDNPAAFQHLMYSDGLALVSVFIEKINQDASAATGFSGIGGVNTFSMIDDNVLITAIGEIPRDTIKQIAQSMTPMN